MEVENFEPVAEDDPELDLAQEIEDYPELKASLQKYLDNPDMKGYTAKRTEGEAPWQKELTVPSVLFLRTSLICAWIESLLRRSRT